MQVGAGVTKDDPRVTRVGRWLRAWNLDELPQLINVVRGEMSLVGPAVACVVAQPGARAHHCQVCALPQRQTRHHGLGAGAWRAGRDRHARQDAKRVEYDLFYIENWSLARDFIILVWTVVSPAAYRNAH
jgi:lipopolysaccharide/colanic/teichoic acid biosynthesis glycosyltransferase